MESLALQDKSRLEDESTYDNVVLWSQMPDPIVKFEQYGVKIAVHPDGTLEFTGHKRLVIDNAEADVDINARNVSIKATDTVKIDGGHHLVQNAARIDLNTEETDPDFIQHRRKGR